MSRLVMLGVTGIVALDEIVAFVSESKRATLRDSQRDEMHVNHEIKSISCGIKIVCTLLREA